METVLAGPRTRRGALEGLAAAGGLGFLPRAGRAEAQGAAPDPVIPPPDPAVVPSASADPDESPTEIKIARRLFEHVTAPVYINGQGPFRFMVDTGANVSCISQVLAQKLDLPKGRQVGVHTIVGRKLRSTVLIGELDIGARKRKRVQAPVLPMVGFTIDGVLGIDWLKGQRLVFGFSENRLEISRSREDRQVKNSVVVPARRKSGQLTIVDAELGGKKISAMIDSGSQFSLGNTALRRAIEQQDPTAREKAVKVSMVSIAGESFDGEQLNLPFIRLGGLNLGNVPVVFTDMPVFRLWDLHETPTIMLGIDLLTQFTTVAVDFGRSAVRFDIAEA